MNELDEILTITGFFESKFKEKGSQFIGLAYPINSEEEFSTILADVKKKYYDASHHGYAYRLLNNTFKYSDAGEPTGTAGIRILNAIDHFNLLNVLVIVVRYFGGTKLGVGPLGKAYYHSAEITLNDSEKIKKTAYKKIFVSADFSFTSLLHKTFGDYEMKIIETEYNENAGFRCYIRQKFMNNFIETITEKTSGSVNIKTGDEIFYV